MTNKKNLAIKLRKQAKSYNEISKQLKIAKSTLSYWFKDIKIPAFTKNKILTNAQKSWARSITKYNKEKSILARDVWQKRALSAKQEIKPIKKNNLKLIGIALYWAEGHKKNNWALAFCNSDPKMVMLMMKFFREICHVPENKLKPSIQIHTNIKENTAKKYWSKISNIPIEYFRKTLYQIPKSSKGKRLKNTLPYGMFRLAISDVKLVNKMRGWIDGVAEQAHK